MNFSNWLYLGIGIGIGLCFYKLLLESRESSSFSTLNTSQHRETELLQELQQTQLAYHKAQEMGQFKAGFLARISHELRSPLGSIIGLHQLILADLCENPEEEREFISQAHEKSLKLLKLIDEILNISKIESQFPEVLTLESIEYQGLGIPSTVAKWTGKDWQILRQGSIKLEHDEF